MRIGINGLYLSSNYKGGVNTFALGLIDGFAKVGGAHEFVIFNGPSNRELFEKYEEYPNFRKSNSQAISCYGDVIIICPGKFAIVCPWSA